jgi:hypothetical protein
LYRQAFAFRLTIRLATTSTGNIAGFLKVADSMMDQGLVEPHQALSGLRAPSGVAPPTVLHTGVTQAHSVAVSSATVFFQTGGFHPGTS